MSLEKYMPLANQAQLKLHDAVVWLSKHPLFPTDAEKLHWMWDCVLVTVALDLSEGATQLSYSGSLRAARSLNRSLLEYSARIHHYARHPDRAAVDGALALNMVRRIMGPVASINDPRLDDVRRLVQSGSHDVPFPNVQIMIRSMLKNYNLTSSGTRHFGRWLETEYSLGSGIIHGSQILFLDVFSSHSTDLPGGLISHRSRFLERLDEMLRTITCNIAMLYALEIRYREFFGSNDLIFEVKKIHDGSSETTVGRHNALLSLLGITRG